jgi:hypothetical protein
MMSLRHLHPPLIVRLVFTLPQDLECTKESEETGPEFAYDNKIIVGKCGTRWSVGYDEHEGDGGPG